MSTEALLLTVSSEQTDREIKIETEIEIQTEIEIEIKTEIVTEKKMETEIMTEMKTETDITSHYGEFTLSPPEGVTGPVEVVLWLDARQVNALMDLSPAPLPVFAPAPHGRMPATLCRTGGGGTCLCMSGQQCAAHGDPVLGLPTLVSTLVIQ
jgi:hypothetical protein